MNTEDFTIPNFTPNEISEYYMDLQLTITPQNIKKPSPQIVQQTFSSILSIFTNTNLTENMKENENFESQYNANTLDLFSQFMALLKVKISFKDFIAPEPKRFITILSNVMNFGMYRETKRDVYERVIKICQEKEEMKEVIEDKISDMLKAFEKIEIAAGDDKQEEQRLDQILDKLEEKARNEYKNFRVLSNDVQTLKDKKNTESDKQSSYQLQIIQDKQEIVKVKSQIVSDPARFVELLNEMKEMLVKEKQQVLQFEKNRDMMKENTSHLEEKKEDIRNLIRKRKLVQSTKSKCQELNKILKSKEMELEEDERVIKNISKKVNFESKKFKQIDAKINNLDAEMQTFGQEANQKMSDLKIQYNEIKAASDSKTEMINNYNQKSTQIDQKMMEEANENNENIRMFMREIDELMEVLNMFFDDFSMIFELKTC